MLKAGSGSEFSLRFLSAPKTLEPLLRKVLSERKDGLLAEHEVYSVVKDMGFTVPPHAFVQPKEDLTKVISEVKASKYAVKGVIRYRKDKTLVTHKTDIGALKFNVPANIDAVKDAMDDFVKKFDQNPEYFLEGLIFVEQVPLSGDFGTEMLVSGYQDPFFGPTVCFGLGGQYVEYLKSIMLPNKAQIFMPALLESSDYSKMIRELPAVKLASGDVRGTKPHLDPSNVAPILSNVEKLMAEYSVFNKDARVIVEEFEVNPTVALNKKLYALDGVMRVSERPALPYTSAYKSFKPLHKIESLTSPKSVLIAGASTKNPRNPGSVILNAAKSAKLNEIMAIHPQAKEVFGVPAYKSIAEVVKNRNGKPVDLFTIGVPAKGAGKLIEEALNTGVANAIQVISGGFGETESGADMQNKLNDLLLSLPNDTRPVVNGPNTVGNLRDGGLNTVFVDNTRSSSTGEGKTNCAILCQSGAFMLSRISDLSPAVRPSVAISVGNQLDLSVTDFFEYFLDNSELTTFGLYMEGLANNEGIRLMNLVGRAKKLGKTVVIYKAGRSQAGVRAAKGHTAAMAGDFGMFKSLLEMAGASVVETLEEWNQLVILSTLFPTLSKIRERPLGVGVVTNAGFEKCACADHLFPTGSDGLIRLPKWSEKTKQAIDKIYAEQKIGEVVDVSEVLDVTPLFTDEGYYKLMRAVMQDPDCDIGVIAGVPETQALHTLEDELDHPKGIFKLTQKLKEEFPDKPIIAVVESGTKYEPLRKAFNSIGVPAFPAIDEASRAIVALAKSSKL